MVDRRFTSLRETLLRAGIASRHARRASMEMHSHYEQMVKAALVRGASLPEAQLEAHGQLGSDAALVQGYISRSELISWASSRAALYFSLFPVLCFAAVGVVAVGGAAACCNYLSAYLQRVPVSPGLAAAMELGLPIAVLWVAPIAVSAAFGVLAYRQRVSLKWPALGIVVLSAFASLLNVDLVLRQGAAPGYIGAGIGVSIGSIAGQAAQAAVRTALVLVPLGFAAYRLRRHSIAA
jgi:hypothetical protein